MSKRILPMFSTGSFTASGFTFKSLNHFELIFVYAILQARILQWVAIPFSRRSSQPRDQTHVSYIEGRFSTVLATRGVDSLGIWLGHQKEGTNAIYSTTDWPTDCYTMCDSLLSEPSGKPKNPGLGSLSLLQGIFPSQESNRRLLHCWRILYQLSCPGSPLEAPSEVQ